jgi:hypothetical protein
MKSERIKSPKIRFGYRAVEVLAKVGVPFFRFMYYIFIAAFILSIIVALIMLFVNTSVEKMLLPPFMTLHGKDYYSITLGNGIRIDSAYDLVTLSDIKTVIYAQIIMVAAICCMMAPISLFLSKLLKNISSGALFNLKNMKYTINIGLSVMIGYTFVLIARRFYNYLLVKTFVADSDAIHLSLGLDVGGIAVGLLIILLGFIIGYVSESILHEVSVPEVHTELVPKQ